MKILHTSDWHLGHALYGYDRTEEQQAMLNQIKGIIKNEQPDAMVLSGDVYHTSQPSAAVQTMFTEAIVAMHQACPTMTIVVTAGNHDSGSKHEIFQTPWRALNVFAIGNIDKENIDSHIIEVPGKGWVVAVPYAYERTIPDGFFQQLLDRVSEKNTDNLPVVMMAHTTVEGCNFTGHDQIGERTVGGVDAVPHEYFGGGFDYLALGHIHHAQYIHNTEHRMRYSGTPLAVSFEETYDHSVSIVEIDTHGALPSVKEISIDNPHPLVTLPTDTDATATWEEAKKLLEDFPSDNPAYIRLNVGVEDFLPAGANEEANAIASGKQCRVCYINAKRPERERTQGEALTVQELQEIAPIEIARRYISNLGVQFDEDMEAMFKEALEAINQQDNK